MELGRRLQIALTLHQVGQQQADRQGLGLEAGLAGLRQQALEQGHPLQGFDLAGILVEDLAQLPFSSAAIVGIAAQVGQQQAQWPAPGLLVGHLLKQGNRLALAIEAEQQAEQALAIPGRRGSARQPALEQVYLRLNLLVQLPVGGSRPIAAALTQPPADPKTTGQQSDGSQAF